MSYIHDHNHWKNWAYWAKGGSISASIAFLFVVFQLVLVPSLFYQTCNGVACIAPFARVVENIFNNSLMPLWSSPLSDPMLNYPTVYIISTLAYYFVIGAFLGLMFEKRKVAQKMAPGAAIKIENPVL